MVHITINFKGTVKVGGNLPLKYCISVVLAKKNDPPPPPFGLKKVTALLMLFISQIVGTHFYRDNSGYIPLYIF